MRNRRFPLPDALRMIAALLVVVGPGLAHAQSLVVEAPPGRLAQPGDYVTLVFTVRSASATTVALDARSSEGWQLLGPSATLALSAGATEPVAITVAVPSDAAASRPAEITLTAVGGGQQSAATTRIEVAPHLDLRLDTPKQVAVGDTLTATVRNAGNVPATATVSVSVGDKDVGTASVSVGPGKSEDATFPVQQEGQYQVTMSRDGTVLAVRFVQTIVHGAPKLSTFTLAGTAYASVDTDLAWHASLDLKGALSDYANLDVRLRGDRPLASHLRVRSGRFGVSVGDFWSDPLGLATMDGFGVAALWAPGNVALEGSASWLQKKQFAGRLEFGYRRSLQDVSLVGAIGLNAGKLTGAGSMRGSIQGGQARVGASFDGERVGASFDMNASDATGSYRVGASAYDLLTPYGRFSASASYQSGRSSVFVGGTAPIGAEAAGQVQAGATTRLVDVGKGSLDGAVILGEPESQATVTYRPDLRETVRPTASVGAVYRTDGLGWGVTTAARLDLGRTGQPQGWTGSIEARGQYYPAMDSLRGRLGARVLGNEAPLTLFASSSWALDTGSVGVGTGAIYNDGPWTLQANAGVSYAPGALGPWGAQVQVQGRYAFDLSVPEGVVQATGGRRLGTLEVHVRADGEPLGGVGLAVGRYRLTTGANGSLRIRLPPGSVKVAVDLSRLTANLQLNGSGTRSVALKDGATTTVSFELHRTAAVRGHVLVDSNGDGVADRNAKGVTATVIVEDALSQSHQATTAGDGSYVVRGLPAGKAIVSLERTPQGSTVVGPSRRDLNLAAGATAVADFLVQPAAARATVFGGPRLRIRSARPEVDRVPPGAAPLLAITTTGHPDHVWAVVEGRTLQAVPTGSEAWQVRLPVPEDATGVLDARIRAVRGQESTERSIQLVVDPKAPLMKVVSLGIGKPGGSVAVDVRTYFAAKGLSAHLDDGPSVALSETSPGHWQGGLPVASDAAAGLHDVVVTARRSGARTVSKTMRARVVAP